MTTTPIEQRVNERLNELIARDGRKLETIAAAAGMDRRYLYKIRRGHRPNLSIVTLSKLLAALGARWADLD